jgi:hypothetical protein
MLRVWPGSLFMIPLCALSACASPGEKPATTVDTNRSSSTIESAGGAVHTVAMFIHEVRAGQKAEYETLMSEIWGTALRKAAQANPYWRETLSGARDFVPAAEVKDTILTYVYMVTSVATEDTSAAAGGFPKALLLDAGYPSQRADSLTKRFGALVSRTSGHVFVERKF